ncbi:MAG: hypothetical protein CMH83_01085 [Nocardioides sp.]|nr:hypothetical protein [Nocardioides sp.]
MLWQRIEVRAGLLYLGLRAVSWVLLALAARDQEPFAGVTAPGTQPGEDVDLRLSWDAQWYDRIATEGYPGDLPVDEAGEVQQNPWAFYPLFPALSRAVLLLGHTSFDVAGPLVALLAGLGAAVVMARLLRNALPAGVGQGPVLGAVAVWAAAPASPVLQMAYSESVGMLLLVLVLWALVRERWGWAGAAALVLGLARPIALPLVVVVVTAALVRVRRAGGVAAVPVRERWALLWTLAATGASGALWPVVAAGGAGRVDAYTATMASWRGDDAIDPLTPWVDTVTWAVEYHRPEFVVPALGMVVPLLLSLALLVPRVAPGLDVRLRVWAAAYALYLLAVVDGHSSVVRYLVPLFPLAVVLVGAHREAVSRWWRWRTAVWIVAGVVAQAGWIWWLVVFVPPSDFPP